MVRFYLTCAVLAVTPGSGVGRYTCLRCWPLHLPPVLAVTPGSGDAFMLLDQLIDPFSRKTSVQMSFEVDSTAHLKENI